MYRVSLNPADASIIGSLPDDLRNAIVDSFKTDRKRQDDILHVTELCHCIRKSYYRRKIPKPMDMDTAWHFFRGRIFHLIFQDLLKDKAGWQTEYRVEISLPNIPAVKVVGRIDAIHNASALYDWKWQSDFYKKKVKKEGALKSHQLQSLTYSFMYKKQEGCPQYPVPYIGYLYSTGSQVIPIGLEGLGSLMIKQLDKGERLYNALVKNIAPTEAEHEDWECKYCDYKVECTKFLSLIKEVNSSG